MDIRPVDVPATAEERAAIDALLGPPQSAWDGGPRGDVRDAHAATVGGRETRGRRHLLLPALRALQSRAGWISEGGLGYVCDRLNVPPAEAWGVATFYALLATSPRPRRPSPPRRPRPRRLLPPARNNGLPGRTKKGDSPLFSRKKGTT